MDNGDLTPLGPEQSYETTSFVGSTQYWCRVQARYDYRDVTPALLAMPFGGALVTAIAGLALKLLRRGDKGIATVLSEEIAENRKWH